jgi:hypothetical protein
MAKVAIASPKSVIWRPKPAARRANLNISISLCVCPTTQKDRARRLMTGTQSRPVCLALFVSAIMIAAAILQDNQVAATAASRIDA